MAKRWSIKNRKRRRDQATSYKADPSPQKHKIGRARSVRAKLKKANPMA